MLAMYLYNRSVESPYDLMMAEIFLQNLLSLITLLLFCIFREGPCNHFKLRVVLLEIQHALLQKM